MAGKTGYIAVTFEFRQEDKRWVGYCIELGTSTFGRSIPETEKKLEDAVLLHLGTLQELGEAEKFFADNGIEFHEGVVPKDVHINAPFRKETFYKPYIQKVPAMVG